MMLQKSSSRLSITMDPSLGGLTSLFIDGRERLAGTSPIFRTGLRNPAGELTTVTALDAEKAEPIADGVRFSGFSAAPSLAVAARVLVASDELNWFIELENEDGEMLTEWVEFPLLSLPKLVDNNPETGGRILFPYNEGVLVSDSTRRQAS